MTPAERWSQRLSNYHGIPYLHQGKGRDGCDCAGLIILVMEELLGVDLNHLDIPDRPYNPPARALLRQLTAAFGCHRNPIGDYSIVLFKSYNGGPQHCGFFSADSLGRCWLLHADRQLGKVEFTEYRSEPETVIYGIFKIDSHYKAQLKQHGFL